VFCGVVLALLALLPGGFLLIGLYLKLRSEAIRESVRGRLRLVQGGKKEKKP
jgi:hypothetical protein